MGLPLELLVPPAAPLSPQLGLASFAVSSVYQLLQVKHFDHLDSDPCLQGPSELPVPLLDCPS